MFRFDKYRAHNFINFVEALLKPSEEPTTTRDANAHEQEVKINNAN